MKKIISFNTKEFIKLFEEYFNCNAEIYVDTEEIEGEEIFFDYIKLNPNVDDFNKVALNVSNTFDIEEINLLTTVHKSILVDFNIVTTLIDSKYSIKTTGWYDIEFSEALDKNEEVVIFEIE